MEVASRALVAARPYSDGRGRDRGGRMKGPHALGVIADDLGDEMDSMIQTTSTSKVR